MFLCEYLQVHGNSFWLVDTLPQREREAKETKMWVGRLHKEGVHEATVESMHWLLIPNGVYRSSCPIILIISTSVMPQRIYSSQRHNIHKFGQR